MKKCLLIVEYDEEKTYGHPDPEAGIAWFVQQLKGVTNALTSEYDINVQMNTLHAIAQLASLQASLENLIKPQEPAE